MSLSVSVVAAIILPWVGAVTVDLSSKLPRGCVQQRYYGEGCSGIVNLEAGTYTGTLLLEPMVDSMPSLEIRGAGIGQTVVANSITLQAGMKLIFSNITFKDTIFAARGGELYANGCEFDGHGQLAVATYYDPVYFKDCIFRASLYLDSPVCAQDSVLTDGAVVRVNNNGFRMATCATSADLCGSSCPSGYKCVDVAKENGTYVYSAFGYNCEAMAPSAGAIEGHGRYTVPLEGGFESCWSVAENLCKDGNDWKSVICNGADVCNNLQPGTVLNYDCSGKGKYCTNTIEGHGSYTVQSGDFCWDIASSLCHDGGNDWKTVICNGADVCSNLHPGQVLNYDCSGKGTYCKSPIEGHGTYTVQSGDMCWDIADSLCQDGGNDWKTVICNGAAVCSKLLPGQVLSYDCSGKSTYCNSPIEAPTAIIV